MHNKLKRVFFQKCICIVFMLAFILCASVRADSGFLAKPYSLAEWSFEDNSKTTGMVCNNYEFMYDAFGVKGKSIVLKGGDNNSICYVPNQKGLYGKTQISFNIAVEKLMGNTKISFCGSDCKFVNEYGLLQLEFIPKISDENIIYVYAVFGDNERELLTETSVQLWNEITIQLDTEFKICNIQINAQDDILAYVQNRDILKDYTEENFCLTKVNFYADNNSDIMYIDNFRVERSGSFSTKASVISHGNGIYTMGAKINNTSSIDKTYIAYMALYNNNNNELIKIFRSDKEDVSGNSIGFIEFFEECDLTQCNEVKAFVWEDISNNPIDEHYQTTVNENGNIDNVINTSCGNFDMKPNKTGSWYILGETVRFTADTLISGDINQIEGVITDANGNFIDEVIVSGDNFKTRGWRWKPEKSGFYQIRFYAVVNGKYTIPIYTEYTRTDLADYGVKFKSYVRNIAVVPAETKSMESRNPKIAFSYQIFDQDALALADKIGFSTARIHSIPWGAQFTNSNAAIHTGPGQFNWTNFDVEMAKIKEYGFDMVGNILYTPKWASPSQSDKINICVREYSTYAPTDMAYFEEFLDALIERYGNDIHIWEIWNEPHLPGASVFWNDTPEKYVELLKTAYNKIKTLQPDDEVWIGGIGARRYLSFYSEILRLGAYPYFDKLSMHGYDVDPWNYNEIAQSMGFEPKEWANTEGHQILTSAGVGADAFISEKRTSFRLIMEFLRQIKYDAQLITKLSVYDWNTIDVMSWAEDNGVNISSDGLFQKTKNIEPRLCAVSMHSFLENTGYDTEFVSELKFSDTQQGVMLNCDGEDVVLLWSLAEEEETVSPQAKEFLLEGAEISDWEFKEYSIDDFVLEPYVIYYIKNLNSDNLNKYIAEESEVIYSEYEKSKQQLNGPVTKGNRAYIFEHSTFKVYDNISWTEEGYIWNGNDKAENYSLKYAAGLCADGMDLIIELKDDNYLYNSKNVSNNQDYIEIGVDTLGNGITTDKIVMKITWDELKNSASIKKTQAPNFSGDIPDNWTSPGKEIINKNISVSREGNVIKYLIHIDYSELYPYYANSDKIHFSIVSYNYDNGVYNGYYEWGEGLAFDMNTPSKYGIIDFTDRVHIKALDSAILVYGTTISDTPMCLIIENKNGEVKFVEQQLSDDKGYFEFTAPLAKGDYNISIGGSGMGKSYIHYNK